MKGRVFNSSILLIAAYYVVHFSYLIFQFLALKILDIENLGLTFFYNSFLAPENEWWTKLKVFLVCGSGLLAVTILLFIFVILWLKLSRKEFRLQVFYNWIIIVSAAFIIAEFLAAPIFGSSSFLHSLLLWLRFESGGGGMYFLALFFLLFIPVVAYFTHEIFIRTTNTSADIKTRNSRLNIYLKLTFIPFVVLSIVFFFMLKLYYAYDLKYILAREATRFAILGVIIIFGAFFSYNKRFISIQKQNDFNVINIPQSLFLIILMTAMFIISYIGLG